MHAINYVDRVADSTAGQSPAWIRRGRITGEGNETIRAEGAELRPRGIPILQSMGRTTGRDRESGQRAVESAERDVPRVDWPNLQIGDESEAAAALRHCTSWDRNRP